MEKQAKQRIVLSDVDLSSAAWFLFAVVLWELLFNRMAWAVTLYAGVGASGGLAQLAMSGQFAMASVGIMSLILACGALPRIAGEPSFGPFPLRVALILLSPFYLPVICVAIFRPVSYELILYSYLAVVTSAVLLAVMTATRKIDSSRKRLIIALAIVELVAALGHLFNGHDSVSVLIRNGDLFSEVLFIVTPIFGFFILKPGSLLAFVKRPHTLGLFFACMTTCFALFVMFILPDPGVLQTVAYRILGLRIPLAMGLPIYVAALFFGSLTIGSAALPSRKWRPTPHSRRIGLGLLLIWSTGIQPSRPYQFILVFVGFLYLSRGLLGELNAREPAPVPKEEIPA